MYPSWQAQSGNTLGRAWLPHLLIHEESSLGAKIRLSDGQTIVEGFDELYKCSSAWEEAAFSPVQSRIEALCRRLRDTVTRCGTSHIDASFLDVTGDEIFLPLDEFMAQF